MSFVWNAKTNFILLHFINQHLQYQSSTFDINWPTIVHDIQLDINSTSSLLKTQYEYLCEIYQVKNDPKLLYSIIKYDYLRSLCQHIEDDDNLILIEVYQFLKHLRIKQIDLNDIEYLINNWNFNYLSDKQKEKKNRLLNILIRLRDSISNSSSQITKEINENKCKYVIKTDLAISDHEEKFYANRRRTQSLTISLENQSIKTNIGVEWFVPINKRQQRSSSLHTRSQSPIQNTSDSSLDQIQIHSVSSWPSNDDKQKRPFTESKFMDEKDLEQISSSESESLLSTDLNENSCKRQRVV